MGLVKYSFLDVNRRPSVRGLWRRPELGACRNHPSKRRGPQRFPTSLPTAFRDLRRATKSLSRDGFSQHPVRPRQPRSRPTRFNCRHGRFSRACHPLQTARSHHDGQKGWQDRRRPSCFAQGLLGDPRAISTRERCRSSGASAPATAPSPEGGGSRPKNYISQAPHFE